MTRHLAIILGVALAILAVAPASVPAQSSDNVLTPRTFIDISKRVLPGVVSINIKIPVPDSLGNGQDSEALEDFLRQWMDPDSLERLPDDFNFEGSGSGVVIGRDEDWFYLVTNRHVVERSDKATYEITLDQSLGEADITKVGNGDIEIVGTDTLSDIAVMRFKAPEGIAPPVIEFADSDKVEIGEWVLALGNPLELNNSVSQGIISAKNRSLGAINRIENLLQTTAVINPGNSGGPLVNLDGKIVGINNAIATRTGRWSGIGFAIPSNQAKIVAEKLMESGKVSRGYLGIAMLDVDDPRSAAHRKEVSVGVSIEDVRPGTPAQEAGLERGDIVVGVDGSKVHNSRMLLQKIANRTAGDIVELSVLRYGDGDEPEKMDFQITLSERPSEEELMRQMAESAQEQSEQRSGKRPIRALGFQLEKADAEGTEGLRIETLDEGSAADRAGLREGDVIVQLNGLDVRTPKEFREALENVEPGAQHIVVFVRDGERQTATLDQVEAGQDD